MSNPQWDAEEHERREAARDEAEEIARRVEDALLIIENRHTAAAPEFDTQNSDLAHYYFENSFGEQLVFVYDYSTAGGRLYHGDGDWKGYEVKDGLLREEVVLKVDVSWLDPDERAWLLLCWNTARKRRPLPTDEAGG